jgi:hypothetical protein
MGQWDEGGTKPETWAKLGHWALFGFAFSCTWDVEHGLGVVFTRTKLWRWVKAVSPGTALATSERLALRRFEG